MFSKITAHTNQDMLNIKLLEACDNLDFEKIKRLINSGANPVFIESHKYMGKLYSTTPFITIALAITRKLTKNEDFVNHKPILDFFIEELQIDTNQGDLNGDTCAHALAQSFNGVFVLKYLSLKGLDLLKTNIKGEYPINKALSPHHQFATVNFLTENMSRIPIDIARRLISLNELQNTPFNQLIAKKSGEERLITILRNESQKIIERQKAYREQCITHKLNFFEMNMKASMIAEKNFEHLSSVIPTMSEQTLNTRKDELTLLIKAINESLREERNSSSTNKHNFNIASNDSDAEDYKSADYYFKTKIYLLEQKLKFANSTLTEVNERLHGYEALKSDNSASIQM